MNQVDEPNRTFLPARVGDRLREGREAQGRTLEDIAAITRIPLRHLRLIEAGEHEDLPATPYSVGFVRTYAQSLGLDAAQLAQDFRAELSRTPQPRAPEPFEPADPKRVPSRLLAIIALVIALIIGGGYAIVRSGSLSGDDAETRARLAAGTLPGAATPTPATPPPPTAAAAPAAPGPVVLTATEPVWLRVYEGNGGERYLEKVLQSGETFTVPATAKDPQILTGRPQAVRVTVGTTVIPPLGTPERTIADVSLKADALLARAQAAPAPSPAPAP